MKEIGQSVEHRPARPWIVPVGVGVAAFCLRLLYLWQIDHAPFFDLRIGDAEGYHEWAKRIAAGDWLGRDVFYQAPLYPYFLAIIYRFLDDSVWTVRLVQAFLGAASCALLSISGIALFGRRGAIAGIGLALYPTAIFLDGLVEKSVIVTFLVAALLALLTMRRWLGAGLILGLLVLTRENALILAAPILCWIVLGPFPGPWRARMNPALIFAAGCSLVLLPVGLRNLAVGREFHLTTSQFGPNFYIGNHAGARGTYESLVEGHGSVSDEREDATRLAEQALGHKLTPGEVSSYWTRQSLEYIRSQPADWLKLVARKLVLTFNATELSDTESQYVYGEWSWLLRILQPFDFGLLLGTAALGVALTAGFWRRIWFLYALAGAYALSVAFFYVFARYRFPLVPILLLIAAGGLIEAIDQARLRRFRRLSLAAGVAAATLLFAHLPLDDRQADRATNYLAIAAGLAKDPARTGQAVEFYNRAIEAAPQFPAAQFGLATLLAGAGRPEDAIPYYRAAIASWPNYAEARYNLGRALADTGRAQEAAEQYKEALRIRPGDADTHIAFGKTLTVLNRHEQALEQYRKGLAARPKDVKGLVGAGVALTQLNRPQEAMQQYQLALEIDPNNAAAHNDLGWTLASQGKIAEAVPHFERALALDPGYRDAKANLDQARRILSRQENKGGRQ